MTMMIYKPAYCVAVSYFNETSSISYSIKLMSVLMWPTKAVKMTMSILCNILTVA